MEGKFSESDKLLEHELGVNLKILSVTSVTYVLLALW